jgi:hypothetical protein
LGAMCVSVWIILLCVSFVCIWFFNPTTTMFCLELHLY